LTAARCGDDSSIFVFEAAKKANPRICDPKLVSAHARFDNNEPLAQQAIFEP
jgi:hypothetical protein